jgi:hypothetical protein
LFVSTEIISGFDFHTGFKGISLFLTRALRGLLRRSPETCNGSYGTVSDRLSGSEGKPFFESLSKGGGCHGGKRRTSRIDWSRFVNDRNR